MNLTANELRIGNKLQKENGEIFTVLRLDNTSDVLVEEQRGLLTLGYNLIGIPLTEEILLKAGFELNEIVIGLYYIVKGNLTITITIEGSNVLNLEISNTNITGVSPDKNNFQYLHQLQNLYFALTGEELTINL